MILLFELFIIAFTIGLWAYMRKKKYKNVTRKFLILFIGVLLFELMSEPMWLNTGFHAWAYLYRDITWILTLGWVSLFMFSMIFVDYAFRKTPDTKKFWIYVLFIEAISVPIEMVLLETGVRGYAPVLIETMSGKLIPLTSVPLEAVYAIPLFTSLILCFYKYINYLFDKK